MSIEVDCRQSEKDFASTTIITLGNIGKQRLAGTYRLMRWQTRATGPFGMVTKR